MGIYPGNTRSIVIMGEVDCKIYKTEGQCCCQCTSRVELVNEKHKKIGYVCVIFYEIHTGPILKWREHSIGCECFDDIKEKE